MKKIDKLCLRFIKENGLYKYVARARIGYAPNIDYFPASLNSILISEKAWFRVNGDSWVRFIFEHEREGLKDLLATTFGDDLKLVLPKVKRLFFFNRRLTVDEFIDMACNHGVSNVQRLCELLNFNELIRKKDRTTFRLLLGKLDINFRDYFYKDDTVTDIVITNNKQSKKRKKKKRR